jgi:type IV secretory pathway VirB10-like protein
MVRHKTDISIIAKTVQVCELRGMVRRILLSCLVLMFVCCASVYGQTTKTVKIKPPNKAKVEKVKKPPKPPKASKAPKPPAPKLTAGEKAAKKANEKQIRAQQKAFKKQTEQTAKGVKAQQKAYTKTLRAMEKQAKKK